MNEAGIPSGVCIICLRVLVNGKCPAGHGSGSGQKVFISLTSVGQR